LQSRRISWLAEEDHAEGQDVWEEEDSIVEIASGDGDYQKKTAEDESVEAGRGGGNSNSSAWCRYIV